MSKTNHFRTAVDMFNKVAGEMNLQEHYQGQDDNTGYGNFISVIAGFGQWRSEGV